VTEAEASAVRRVALVTGGASGLGLASARRLAADGLRIALSDRTEDAARQQLDSLEGTGHLALGCDVTDEAAIRAAFDQVECELGQVAVLCCFAGIVNAGSPPGRIPFEEMGCDEWDRVMTVNGRGTFLCLREMIRRCRAHPRTHGRIVTVSSLAGQIGGVQSNAGYAASKGAILSMTKQVAREAAHLGVTANTVAPGPIDTPLLRQTVPDSRGGVAYLSVSDIPLGRIGVPAEVAAVVSFLCSVDAGFVTGATIDVNGGMCMR